MHDDGGVDPEDGVSAVSNASPDQILSKAISEAKVFFLTKTNSNKGRYHFGNRASWMAFGIGAVWLSFHAYEILQPILQAFCITEASAVGFLVSKPTVVPTLLVASGGFGFSWIKKRGYLNAWIRSSLTLSEVKVIELRYSIELAAGDRDVNEIVREFAPKLIEAVKTERDAWSKQTLQDLESLNDTPKK